MEEEFLVWKKNTPLLYGFVLSHSLEWPSLTVQFLPSSFSVDLSLSVHRLLLSTHTSDGFPNFLMLADAHLPSSFDYPPDLSVPKVLIKCTQGRVFDEMPLCLTCNSHVCMPISLKNLGKMDVSKFDIIQKICVDGEVNRARYMHHKPSVIAAKTSGCEVYVFDCDKHPMNEGGLACQPDLRLMGHAKEGFGLSWSPFKEGYLLSGSNDCKICLWDVSTMPQNKSLQATHVYEAHKSVVGDVSWHLKDENLFGSVGDDCRLIIWDLRTNKPQHSVQAHEKEVNYLSFNPYNDRIVATASSDTTVGLFDMRKLVSPLHTLGGHEEEVFQVEWDPNHETVLASSAGDRRLMVWDLNRIGDEQLEGEAEDGPPELLFSHAGHKAKISDFSWNKNQSWVISSVAEDNSIQVWQMDKNIYHEDDDLQAE